VAPRNATHAGWFSLIQIEMVDLTKCNSESDPNSVDLHSWTWVRSVCAFLNGQSAVSLRLFVAHVRMAQRIYSPQNCAYPKYVVFSVNKAWMYLLRHHEIFAT
jgi:hypothetical protein